MDREHLEAALDARLEDGPFILVQGECPAGADLMAKQWAIKRGVPHEDVPANWDDECGPHCYRHRRFRKGKPYCPAQGHLRNQAMVDRGADVCLAFPLPDSRGTIDCMKRAKRAGIPVFTP
jgi:hypothetical protein